MPVYSEDDAVEFINALKKDYSDSNHVCYAYSLVSGAKKFSDDGEPSGTAGMPILNIIEKRELSNIVIGVVRYFGGVKLGMGGLVRAYSKSAGDCINNAQIVSYSLKIEYKITLDYENSKLINKLEKEEFIKVTSKEFKEQIEVTLLIKKENKDKLQLFVNELFNKQVDLIKLGESFKGE